MSFASAWTKRRSVPSVIGRITSSYVDDNDKLACLLLPTRMGFCISISAVMTSVFVSPLHSGDDINSAPTADQKLAIKTLVITEELADEEAECSKQFIQSLIDVHRYKK